MTQRSEVFAICLVVVEILLASGAAALYRRHLQHGLGLRGGLRVLGVEVFV